MNKREAAKLIENYIYWRDVKIPSLMDDRNKGQNLTANYSFGVRSHNSSSDPIGKIVVSQISTFSDMVILERIIVNLDRVRSFLDEDCQQVFDLMSYGKKYSWIEMIDRSGLTEREFRTRRNRILEYIIDVFEGTSLFHNSA